MPRAAHPAILLLALILAWLLPATAQQGAPTWWDARGVRTPGAPADDYAVANLGQLEHVASQAAAAMEATLPGGAGPEIEAMVNAWASPQPGRDDYAALTVGQLKAVGAQFHAHLAAVENRPVTYPWGGPAALPATSQRHIHECRSHDLNSESMRSSLSNPSSQEQSPGYRIDFDFDSDSDSDPDGTHSPHADSRQIHHRGHREHRGRHGEGDPFTGECAAIARRHQSPQTMITSVNSVLSVVKMALDAACHAACLRTPHARSAMGAP